MRSLHPQRVSEISTSSATRTSIIDTSTVGITDTVPTYVDTLGTHEECDLKPCSDPNLVTVPQYFTGNSCRTVVVQWWRKLSSNECVGGTTGTHHSHSSHR